MKNLKLLGSVAAVSLAISASCIADDDKRGNFRFEPIDSSANSADWDPAAPWKLPEGFSQRVVSDETDLNIYDGGRDDWHDMNVVNETGPQAGRFMYRTHELRYPANQPEGGVVSVVEASSCAITSAQSNVRIFAMLVLRVALASRP